MDALGANLLPFAAAALALAGLLLSALGRRRAAARREEEDQALRREASLRGLRYERPAGGEAEVTGAQVYTGSTGGVAWRAEVMADPRWRDEASRARSEWTRITAAAGRSPPGRFLLVMRLPGERRLPAGALAQGGGVMAALARQAMEAALDLYVGQFFGAKHKALVNVAGAEVLDLVPGHFVLCNDPPAARAILGEPARRRLAALAVGEPGADGPAHGLLWSPDGLILGCPVALRRPEDVKRVAEQVAGLCAVGGGAEAAR